MAVKLEGDVEEVWDQAGRTRYGYDEPGEAADQMIEEALAPFQMVVVIYGEHLAGEAPVLSGPMVSNSRYK